MRGISEDEFVYFLPASRFLWSTIPGASFVRIIKNDTAQANFPVIQHWAVQDHAFMDVGKEKFTWIRIRISFDGALHSLGLDTHIGCAFGSHGNFGRCNRSVYFLVAHGLAHVCLSPSCQSSYQIPFIFAISIT